MSFLAVCYLVASSGLVPPASGDPERDSPTKHWVGQLTVSCQRPVGSVTQNETVCPSAEGSAVNCTGKLGSRSPALLERGVLVHVRTGGNREVTTGCEAFESVPKLPKWIAFVKRGDCRFDVKMQNAVRHNATAVVVYDVGGKEDVPVMSHEAYDMVSIIIPSDCGMMLASRLDDLAAQGLYLESSIVPLYERDSLGGDGRSSDVQAFSRTSVLIVSITFIVLMAFSLGWLVFYYVQRYRFARMKDDASRLLANAAKQAIKRLPKRTVRASEMSENDPCAVCIESYNSDDVIRELPCGHVFHKHCVDKWLISKRECPMCKLNILEALGFTIRSIFGDVDRSLLRGMDEGTVVALLPPRTAMSQPPAASAAATHRAEIEMVPAILRQSCGSNSEAADECATNESKANECEAAASSSAC